MAIFRKLVVVLALLLAACGFGVAQQVTPASAYLTSCQAIYQSGYGASVCASHANNGGLNQQRVVVTCKPYIGSPSSVTVYGPWVNEDQYSVRYCNISPYNTPVAVTYQLR